MVGAPDEFEFIDQYDTDAREIRRLPDEKLVELFRASFVKRGECPECGCETWLIAASGHNSHSNCHECGAEYRITG